MADASSYRVQQFIPTSLPSVDSSFTPSFGGSYTATALFKKGCTDTSNAVRIKALPKFKGIKGQQRNLCGGSTFVYTTAVATNDTAVYSVKPEPGISYKN